MHTNLASIYRREAKSNNRDYPLVKPATGSTFFSHLTGKFQIPRSKSTHKEHQNFVQDAITLLYDLTCPKICPSMVIVTQPVGATAFTL